MRKNHLLGWLGAALFLLTLGFWDAAVVASSASVVTPGQMAAGAIAYGLIAGGVFVTVWQIRRVVSWRRRNH